MQLEVSKFRTLNIFWKGVVRHPLHRLKRFNLQERDKILDFRFLAGQTDIPLRLQNFLCEPTKVAEISGVLFASCSNAPKRGKKCDEFKSLYQTHSQTAILWTHQSPSKKNNTTSNSISHGQEVHNLTKVPYWQYTCPSPSAPLLGTFDHGNISISPLRAQTL